MIERVKSKRRRGRLTEIKLSELSLVDRPANPHARVTLFKRDDEVTKKYGSVSELPASVRDPLPAAAQRQFMGVVNSALDGGSSEASAFKQAWGALKNAGWRKGDGDKWVKKDYVYPAEPAAYAREIEALDFDEVLAEEEAREAGYRVNDAVHSKWSALQQSFHTIACDESVAAVDKVAAMQESLRQFIASLAAESETIAESMTKAISAVPVLAGLLGEEGEEPMTAAEKQQLAELQKTVDKLTKQLAAATTDDAAKKASDLQAELDKAAARVAELTEKAEKDEAEQAELVAKAAMSDAEKEYMAGLSGDAKMKFMQASPADRAKMMKKSVEDDPVVYKSEDTGEEFRKSDDPRLVSAAKRADEASKIAKEERERRETSELTKRAEEEPIKSLPGETADKVEVLRAISKMDEQPRKTLETMLETGAKSIAAAFDTIGHQRKDVAKGSAEFGKRVAEVAKRDGISQSAAMTRARTEYPEEYAAAYPSAGN